MNELLDKAKDKQEELGDRENRDGGRKVRTEAEMITQLKKLEIKLQELVEMRKVFQYFKPKDLQDRQKQLNEQNKTIKHQKKAEKQAQEMERAQKKIAKRLEIKDKLVVAKPIRDTQRSRKTEVKKKEVKQKVDPEQEEMRRYLGIGPDDWNIPQPAETAAQADSQAQAAKNSDSETK
jgi:hypothetical protein